MAQDTTPSIIMYPGGTDKFPVPFDKGYYGEVKVLFVRRGVTGYEHAPASSNYVVNGRLYAWGAGSNYIYTHTPTPAIEAPIYNDQDVDSGKKVEATAGQTITVDGVSYIRATQHDISNHLMLTWIGEELGVDDYICIGRDTERGQPYSLPNNQKHIEGALDNIERQVQELKDKTDNALVVDPTHTIDARKMGPIDWLETIVRSTDKTARAIRYHNGYLQFSLEDPDVPLDQKTWTSILNTVNVTTIREWYDEEKNEYHFQYSKDNGVSWKELPLYDAVNGFETRLSAVEKEQIVLGSGVKGNADAIQETRAESRAADSEIRQTLNSHTAELTTLRGNQAALGDQVSGIEEKIPESASGSNPLVTKQQLAAKQDQLTAGDNIIISGNVISATGAGGGAGLDFIVVQELPETGQKGVVYLIAKDGTAPDVYDEYVWINATQTFELIGNTQVDLSDYAKKEDLSDYLPLSGGTMTGPVEFKSLANKNGYGFGPIDNIGFNTLTLGDFNNGVFTPKIRLGSTANASIVPLSNGSLTLGGSVGKWQNVYTQRLNNGADLNVPTEGGTLARLEDLENIDALPDQTGNAGKVLVTDGETASWQEPAGGTKVIFREWE